MLRLLGRLPSRGITSYLFSSRQTSLLNFQGKRSFSADSVPMSATESVQSVGASPPNTTPMLYQPTDITGIYADVRLDPLLESDLQPHRAISSKLFAMSAVYVHPREFNYALPASGVPEFAFVGRSNVGKSSLIAKLLNAPKLVKISKTPGCTKSVNYFALSGKGNGQVAANKPVHGASPPTLYLVDLPGYGFAEATQSEQARWKDFIKGYLSNRDLSTLRRVYVLIDARRGPSPSDREMMDLLNDLHLPYQIILTKSDAVSKSMLQASIHDTFSCINSRTGAWRTASGTTKRVTPAAVHTNNQKGKVADRKLAQKGGKQINSAHAPKTTLSLSSCLPYVHVTSCKTSDGLQALKLSMAEVMSHVWSARVNSADMVPNSSVGENVLGFGPDIEHKIPDGSEPSTLDDDAEDDGGEYAPIEGAEGTDLSFGADPSGITPLEASVLDLASVEALLRSKGVDSQTAQRAVQELQEKLTS